MSEDKKKNVKEPRVISPSQKVLRLPDLVEVYAMSRSAIYRAMEKDDFPKPFKLTGRSIGWSRDAVDQWLAERPTGIAPCADNEQYQTAAYLGSRPGARSHAA